jgi:hypothetical protein
MNQCSDELRRLPVYSRDFERCLAVVVLDGDIRPFSHQQLDGPGPAEKSGRMQGGRSIGGPGIDIRTCLDQQAGRARSSEESRHSQGSRAIPVPGAGLCAILEQLIDRLGLIGYDCE